MGGKNLCVTNQHNASTVSVQKHHISLNNGDQTTTVLSPANSSQNAEIAKSNVMMFFHVFYLARIGTVMFFKHNLIIIIKIYYRYLKKLINPSNLY